MSRQLAQEILSLGGDITDETWQWLLYRGPHGESFSWGQTNNNPRGYVGVDHLAQIIDEKSFNDPMFIVTLRQTVKCALHSTNTNILRRAIQLCSVMGELEMLKELDQLVMHNNPKVSADAKSARFYLKKRLAT